MALVAATAGSPVHDVLSLTGGAIGFGIPTALGAAIGAPDRPVLSLQADGSAMYTIAGLWTQARENLDVTTVLYNNGAYDILRIELQRVGAENADAPGPKALDLLDLGRPTMDFVKIAEGMGVPARRATTAEELAAALARCVRRTRPPPDRGDRPVAARLTPLRRDCGQIVYPPDYSISQQSRRKRGCPSCPICSRQWPPSGPSLRKMNTSIISTVVEIVSADLPRSLAFYRLLGLEVPDPEGPHVEVELPGGNRLAFDTEDTIAGMHPGWTAAEHGGPDGTGVRPGVAGSGRRAVRPAHRGGTSRHAGTVRRALGTAVCQRRRSGRHDRRPVRGAGDLSHGGHRNPGEVTHLAV